MVKIAVNIGKSMLAANLKRLRSCIEPAEGSPLIMVKNSRYRHPTKNDTGNFYTYENLLENLFVLCEHKAFALFRCNVLVLEVCIQCEDEAYGVPAQHEYPFDRDKRAWTERQIETYEEYGNYHRKRSYQLCCRQLVRSQEVRLFLSQAYE